MRLAFESIVAELVRVLQSKGFSSSRAKQCAHLVANAHLDGVYSHGLNRFPRFMAMLDNGSIDVVSEPEKIASMGAIEQWDGKQGVGNLNAQLGMDRAISLAKKSGAGIVGMRNTNHWMRGGSYGWQAADAGMVGICWTNTNQNLPPWGSSEARIGNNPLIMAVPRPKGHIVLDMAMSQFSYGALSSYKRNGAPLPVPGGYDEDGQISYDAGAIETSCRPLPVGFWKGSALSIVLDVAAALFSGGQATHQISKDPLEETGLSQVFMAFSVLTHPDLAQQIADHVVEHLHESPVLEGQRVYYPGERTLATRKENEKKGIPVDEALWASICAM